MNTSTPKVVLLVQTVVRRILVDLATTKQGQVVPVRPRAIPKVVLLVQTVVRRIPVDWATTKQENHVPGAVAIPKVVGSALHVPMKNTK